jgi:dihydroorotate dehydrogenase electron transfer subunit
VLLGGGIGVAPLLFMAQSMKTRMFQFMMGFGSASEIIAVDHVAGHRMELSVATDDGTRGHAGPVTDLLERYLKKHKSKKQAISLFACGPKPMLKRVAEMTMDRGISCQLSLEASMACGLGACQGCAVKASSNEDRTYYHVCRDGPVLPVQAIDWDAL